MSIGLNAPTISGKLWYGTLVPPPQLDCHHLSSFLKETLELQSGFCEVTEAEVVSVIVICTTNQNAIVLLLSLIKQIILNINCSFFHSFIALSVTNLMFIKLFPWGKSWYWMPWRAKCVGH